MNTNFIRRAAVAVLTAAALIGGGVATAAPAQAATVHNRMTIKINKVKYTIDEWNTTSKSVSYNIDCRSMSLWAGYRYTVYKSSSSAKKYLTMNVDPLRTYYLNDYYWAKTRSYKSVTDFKKAFKARATKNLDSVKTSIGYYCLRDARRAETKTALEQYVDYIRGYIIRHPGVDTDLSTVKFQLDEIGFNHKFSKTFTVKGTPTSGFTASVDDRTDKYIWYYDSATAKYAELSY